MRITGGGSNRYDISAPRARYNIKVRVTQPSIVELGIIQGGRYRECHHLPIQYSRDGQHGANLIVLAELKTHKTVQKRRAALIIYFPADRGNAQQQRVINYTHGEGVVMVK